MRELYKKSYPNIQWFGGINTGKSPINIEQNEATDMMNISSDEFPSLAPSKQDAIEGVNMTFPSEAIVTGTLFDGNLFFIVKNESTSTVNMRVFKDDAWAVINITDGQVDQKPKTLLLGADEVTFTTFDKDKTVLACGGAKTERTDTSVTPNKIYPKGRNSFITVTAAPNDSYAFTVHEDEDNELDYNGESIATPTPKFANLAATKDRRLIAASTMTDELIISQYREMKWEKPDDIQIFHIYSEAGKNAAALTVYNDYTLYFKQNETYILYGRTPDSYSLDKLSGSVGCAERLTVAETNAGLMWLAHDGVYAYSATTLPYKISDPIKKYIDSYANAETKSACAASNGRKYYLSLSYGDDGCTLVYDTQNKMWNVEEHLYKSLYRYGDAIYGWRVVDGGTEYGIYKLGAENAMTDWLFVTKPFDIGGPSARANISRMHINLKASAGTSLKLYISPDVDGNTFTEVWARTFVSDTEGKEPVYIRPCAALRSMDHVRIKVEGKGDITVYAIETDMRSRTGTY